MSEPLDEIDADLHAACEDRHEAWRRLAIKDTPANREAYDVACVEVDALLEMRFDYARAERMVTQ